MLKKKKTYVRLECGILWMLDMDSRKKKEKLWKCDTGKRYKKQVEWRCLKDSGKKTNAVRYSKEKKVADVGAHVVER